jgi:ferric-dicitrate binding protein FerR (iron transport regulator)
MESPEKKSPNDRGRDDAMRDTAARWVVRQDRTLSAAEVAELAAWLDSDPRHGDALDRARGSWKKFREIGAAVRRMPEPATEAVVESAPEPERPADESAEPARVAAGTESEATESAPTE